MGSKRAGLDFDKFDFFVFPAQEPKAAGKAKLPIKLITGLATLTQLY